MPVSIIQLVNKQEERSAFLAPQLGKELPRLKNGVGLRSGRARRRAVTDALAGGGEQADEALIHECVSALSFEVYNSQMILGVGTDLAEVSRIRDSIARFGERFLNRIFTSGERTYALSKANSAERFAARFAAKEAGMKALGTGWSQGVTWHDFAVANEPSGRPTLRLSGVAREVANRLGVRTLSVSLTHTKEMAFAVVILEDGK